MLQFANLGRLGLERFDRSNFAGPQSLESIFCILNWNSLVRWSAAVECPGRGLPGRSLQIARSQSES